MTNNYETLMQFRYVCIFYLQECENNYYILFSRIVLFKISFHLIFFAVNHFEKCIERVDYVMGKIIKIIRYYLYVYI